MQKALTEKEGINQLKGLKMSRWNYISRFNTKQKAEPHCRSIALSKITAISQATWSISHAYVHRISKATSFSYHLRSVQPKRYTFFPCNSPPSSNASYQKTHKTFELSGLFLFEYFACRNIRQIMHFLNTKFCWIKKRTENNQLTSRFEKFHLYW